MSAVLVTITLSHYCERARWALDRAGVAYREEAHGPLFHASRTLPLGQGRSVPKLVLDDGRVVADSDDIVTYADDACGGALRGHQTESARALEKKLAASLGPAVRRYLYHTLLDDPGRVMPLLLAGTPPLEQLAGRLVSPFIRRVMRRSMNIRAETAERDLRKIRGLLDEVGVALTGRRYLDGERFGATDLTFASLAAPLTEVTGYGVPLEPLATRPEPLRSDLTALSAHPAMVHVRACYRLERERRS